MNKTFFLLALCWLGAAGAFAQRGSCGTGVTWSLSDGTLTISGEGNMNDFSFSGSWDEVRPSYEVFKDDIQKVVIEGGIKYVGKAAFSEYPIKEFEAKEGVETIGTWSFEYCHNLVSVKLPKSLRTIGGCAFYGCNMNTIVIPENVKEIGGAAFASCKQLKEIRWNAIDCTSASKILYHSAYTNSTSPVKKVVFGKSVRSIPEGLFYDQIALETVVTSGNIETVGYHAFHGTTWYSNQIGKDGMKFIDKALYEYSGTMQKPTAIDIPEGVVSITDVAFGDQTKLVKVSIPSTLTSISCSAFYGCSALTDVVWNAADCVVTGFNFYNYHCVYGPFYEIPVYSVVFGKSVRKIPVGLFGSCSSLEEVTFSDSIKVVGMNAFYTCEALKKIDLPESIDTIGYHAFYSTSLETITIPKNVRYINSSFNSSKIKKLYYNAKRADIDSDSFERTLFSNISHVVFGEEVEVIPGGLLSGNLEEVTIPNSVDSIGYYAFDNYSNIGILTVGTGLRHFSGFNECYISSLVWNAKKALDFTGKLLPGRLTNVVFGDQVEYIPGNLLYGCNKLETVTLSNSIKGIGAYAFKDCASLKEIIFPKSLTEIGTYAFSGCEAITSLTIGENVSKVGENAFWNCTSLKSVIWNATDCADFTDTTLPSTLSAITFGNKVKHIPDHLCQDCESITELALPVSVRSIGEKAFYKCYSLTHVTLPDSLTTIGDYAFWSTDLKEINFPSSLDSIGTGAFEHTSLTTLFIPASLTKIGEAAFGNTEQLVDVVVAANEPPVVNNPFRFNYYLHGRLENIYVPDVELYRQAKGWSAFYKKLKPMVSISYDSLTYNGRGPKIAYTNNLADYTLQMEDYKPAANAGYYETTIKATYSGKHNFSVSIPCRYNITKAWLTLTPKDTTKVYGKENPEFLYTVEGLVNNEKAEDVISERPIFACEATAKTDVGTYLIHLTNQFLSADNYNIACHGGELTITPKPLVITAKDTTKLYGESVPEFQIAYDGFVNDDNEEIIKDYLWINCEASEDSEVGDYVINLGTWSTPLNYYITTVNGILHIAKARQTIDWNPENLAVQIGDSVILSAQATSQMEVKFESEKEDIAKIFVNKDGEYVLKGLKEGTIIVRAVQPGNKNWEKAETIEKPFKITVPTSVSSNTMNRSKVSARNGYIYISDIVPGEHILICSASGQQIYNDKAQATTLKVHIGNSGIYLVKIGEKIFKCSLRR